MTSLLIVKEDSILNLILYQLTDNNYNNSDEKESELEEFKEPEFKKPKIDSDNSQDLSTCILEAVKAYGKFRMFKDLPEAYLHKVSSSVYDQNKNELVDRFFEFLDKDQNQWYFSDVYQKKLTFDKFRNLFISHVNLTIFEKVRCLSFGLEDYLESIDVESNCPNKLRTYFKNKAETLQTFFDLDDENARFFSLCFLDYEDYLKLYPVLKNSTTFKSILELEDNRLNSLPQTEMIPIDENEESTESAEFNKLK